MEALDNRLRACSNHLRNIHSTYDLGRLTLDAVVDLKSFCVSEEEIMTKICMVDLYHIIGMGELTPPQMMKFTYTLQKYQQYRPTIKAITKWSGSILDLPKIPVETQYKLQGLGDLTLYSNCIGAGEVDDASIEDYNQLKVDTKLPYKVEGSTIKVDLKQFDYFVSLMTTIFKSNISAENFRKKIATRGEYLGITWADCVADEAIGFFKSPDTYAKLSSYYKKRI
jgi:hypothetical protein